MFSLTQPKSRGTFYGAKAIGAPCFFEAFRPGIACHYLVFITFTTPLSRRSIVTAGINDAHRNGSDANSLALIVPNYRTVIEFTLSHCRRIPFDKVNTIGIHCFIVMKSVQCPDLPLFLPTFLNYVERRCIWCQEKDLGQDSSYR
jgi:hypothetical protein